MKGADIVYLIALCDDEQAELRKTEQMLYSYGKKHPETDLLVTCFESVNELLRRIREEAYMPDLVLLDIYMPEKMGIEAARELRDMGNRSRIVFLTMSKEHALDAFGVDAVQYLVKPVSEAAFFSVLDRFPGSMERKNYVVLRIKGRIQRVAVDEILYCEAQGKIQCLHLLDGTQSLLRMTMKKIFDMLSGYKKFVRVGIAYIMNLEHIDNLNAQDICLYTGKRIALPRGAYRALKEQYFRYYCG